MNEMPGGEDHQMLVDHLKRTWVKSWWIHTLHCTYTNGLEASIIRCTCLDGHTIHVVSDWGTSMNLEAVANKEGSCHKHNKGDPQASHPIHTQPDAITTIQIIVLGNIFATNRTNAQHTRRKPRLFHPLPHYVRASDTVIEVLGTHNQPSYFIRTSV